MHALSPGFRQMRGHPAALAWTCLPTHESNGQNATRGRCESLVGGYPDLAHTHQEICRSRLSTSAASVYAVIRRFRYTYGVRTYHFIAVYEIRRNTPTSVPMTRHMNTLTRSPVRGTSGQVVVDLGTVPTSAQVRAVRGAAVKRAQVAVGRVFSRCLSTDRGAGRAWCTFDRSPELSRTSAIQAW